VDVFAALWGCSAHDLLVSFDAASFHFPPEVPGVGWEDPVSHDLHTDQSFTRNDFECIQAWVTANHVDTGDATLALLEGSHLYHGDFAAHFGITDR
jgi:hypothetical protein